jgi:hypothetical protein
MLYTSNKVYESPNSIKTCCKTYAWSVGVLSNERRYRWAASRFVILFKLEKPPVEHLEGFIFLPREGGKLQKFSELFIRNSNPRTIKNSPTGSAKAGASMVGTMFAVASMTC